MSKKETNAILTTCTVSFHVQQDIEPDMWNHYIFFSRLHSTGCFNNLDMQYLESPLNTIPLPQTCVSFYLLVKRKTSDSQLLIASFSHLLNFHFKHKDNTDSIYQNTIFFINQRCFIKNTKLLVLIHKFNQFCNK